MAVTVIPNVTNWTVTPQNGQAGYFTLMNTWLGQSTSVITSLQVAITAQNIANSEINNLAIQTENNAIIATGLANFQGAWSNSITYSKGQSVESTAGSKIYYTSKVDNNLNHIVTDTNYWIYNPINDKLDKDFSILTDKATPSDTDILPIRESGGLLKKLSWANLKSTLFNGAISLTSNGYIKLPTIMGNLIIQWGTAATGGGGGVAITFPIAFTASAYHISGSCDVMSVQPLIINFSFPTTTGSAAYVSNGSGAGMGSIGIKYITIGK